MIAILDLARRARLRALLIAELSNGADVWDAHRTESTLPPLHFRNGLVLTHGEGDAPLFLFFEIFANACYRRQLSTVAGGAIVDIGANIGAFTLDCAARFPAVRIEAYEPNPRAYRILQENIVVNRLEHRVRAYAEAVGRTSGVLELWGNSGNLIASAYPLSSEANHPSTTCPMVDLDTVPVACRWACGARKNRRGRSRGRHRRGRPPCRALRGAIHRRVPRGSSSRCCRAVPVAVRAIGIYFRARVEPALRAAFPRPED